LWAYTGSIWNFFKLLNTVFPMNFNDAIHIETTVFSKFIGAVNEKFLET
jgi:hypothetical protein